MTRTSKRARKPAFLALLCAAALSGCASLPQPASSITINSDPPGADVIVSGKQIGTTPLPVVLDKVFPRHWTGRIKSDVGPGFAFYRRLETVTIKKVGCKPYTKQYTGHDLRHDFTVTLTCGPQYMPAPQTAAPPPAAAAPSGYAAIEQRLQELKNLKKKGLITDQEYQEQQQRILNQL
ncbi:MAG: PEGA domain-containing protein [Gammaproteobacteria bacterium]|nr:PEGA domain-containing protein [Gammaproteobacteria bacterium]